MAYQHKREPLSYEEMDKLANATTNLQEKLVIFTLLDTGIRVSELAELERQNIHWQARRLVIFGKGGIYGKKSKRRVVPMTERVRLVLEHHFSFEDSLGITARTIQNLVKRVANRAGIIKPVSPHVLRHTFGITCHQKGVPSKAVQILMGHEYLSTTEIYFNMSPEDAIRNFESKW